MTDPFDRAVEREKAQRRERRYRGVWARFVVHLRVFVTVNLVLIGVWVAETFVDEVDGGDQFWPMDVICIWGIALLIHYILVVQITRRWRPRSRYPSSTASPT